MSIRGGVVICEQRTMTDEDGILAANAAYYRAFGAADFASMSEIWADDDVSCVHPGWPALIGRESVLLSYRNILRNASQEAVQPQDERALVSGGEGRVFCIEIAGAMALVATNWFRRVDGAWRMIHHQAGPLAPLVNMGASPSSPGRLN
ncbi:MAG: nuclear transport factor 2 family protein [Methylocella sp.]